MSLTQTINYDNASNFTFDNTKIQITAGHAILKLISLPAQTFTQSFASSSGFLFDATKTEFVGGVLRQKDTRPANETFYAELSTMVDGNWGNGTLTGTLVGSAVISGGKLVLSGGSANWSATGNADSAQVGAYRLRVTPNYSGTPSQHQFFLATGTSLSSLNNFMSFYHDQDGKLYLDVYNSGGIITVEVAFGLWAPVSGTDYEFELDYDFTAGAIRVFIDGVQFGTTNISTFLGRTAPTFLVTGIYPTVPKVTNFSLDNIEIFSAVQHTSDYSAPSPLPYPTIYVADSITFPGFMYSGLGDLVSFDNSSITDTNSPGYILNGKYWNGTNWVTSNGTYAQSNTAAVISAHIGNLLASDTLGILMVTQESNISQESISAMSFGYTGQIYPVTNPSILNNSAIDADLLTAFSIVANIAGSDAIHFVLVINGQDTYFNGSAWVDSTGYSESNIAAQVNSNLASLVLTGGAAVQVKAYLHSNDGTSSPTITSTTISYDFQEPPVPQPARCIVYAFLNDLIGSLGTNAKTTLIVELKSSFIYGSRVVAAFTRIFTVNASGYVETSPSYLKIPDVTADDGIVETQTLGISPYKFTISYTSNGQIKTVVQDNVQIPNQTSVNLSTLLTL